MTLSASGLKDAIKTAVLNKTDASLANTAFGNAIADYLKANAVIDFTWEAYDSTPTKDPVTSCTGGITTLTISLTPSGATSASTALTTFASTLTATIKLGLFNVTQSGWTTTPLAMSDLPSLSLSPSNKTTQDDALLSLATSIYDWITAYVPATPLSGSHGSYTGTATATGIT